MIKMDKNNDELSEVLQEGDRKIAEGIQEVYKEGFSIALNKDYKPELREKIPRQNIDILFLLERVLKLEEKIKILENNIKVS